MLCCVDTECFQFLKVQCQRHSAFACQCLLFLLCESYIYRFSQGVMPLRMTTATADAKVNLPWTLQGLALSSCQISGLGSVLWSLEASQQGPSALQQSPAAVDTQYHWQPASLRNAIHQLAQPSGSRTAIVQSPRLEVRKGEDFVIPGSQQAEQRKIIIIEALSGLVRRLGQLHQGLLCASLLVTT